MLEEKGSERTLCTGCPELSHNTCVVTVVHWVVDTRQEGLLPPPLGL